MNRILIFLGSFGAAIVASGQWDPRAINVFPDHKQVARNEKLVPEMIEQGKELFEAKFNKADGAGRPAATGDSKPTSRIPENDRGLLRTAGPDALSCAACHNQPATGGSGDFAANVFVGAHFSDPPTYRVDPEITNERNTVTLFGSGLIEVLAREMTRQLHALRDGAIATATNSGKPAPAELVTKGVSFGSITAFPDGTIDMSSLEGVDYDLIVRPFGAKGVAASLREFTIAALNQHHGIQAIERFGWERTGFKDFDLDGVVEEFSIGQLTALVLFQAKLPPPEQKYSTDASRREQETKGEHLFKTIGCATCHIPALRIESPVFVEPNQFNRPGAITPKDGVQAISVALGASKASGYEVKAYTDLKRHNLCDDETHHFCNEKRKQDNIDTKLFLTSKLWDAFTSAPYGHRGDLPTLSEAILQHGGEARTQRDNFRRLSETEKRSVIAFLQTLGKSQRLNLTDAQPESVVSK